ncbi:MAG: hypothetical protein OEY97_06985 [Nitrospirota bacterium]|nr:hypothetical protein [Nitrospirota bacterium]
MFRPTAHQGTAMATVLLALAGALSLLPLTARYGPAVTPDGVNYLAAARNLVTGGGITGFSGDPLTLWPPLYPMLLALLSLFGLEPLTAARLVGAGAFGLILLTVGWWLRGHVRQPLWVVLGVVAVAASDLLLLAGYVLSEAVFVLLALLALICAQRYLRSPAPVTLAAFAGFSALAFATRYAGVALLLTGVALLLTRPGARLPVKIRDVLAYGAVASLPATLWMVRNQMLTGTLMGQRGQGSATLADNLGAMAGVGLEWVWPPSGVPGVLPLVARIALLAGMGIALWAVRDGWRRERLRLPGELVPWVAFVGIYAGFLLLVRTVLGGGGIEPRFLLPLHAPLVMMAVWGLSRLRLEPGSSPLTERVVTVGLPVLACLWLLCYPLTKTVGMGVFAYHEGVGGYTTSTWQRMHLAHFLRERPLEGVVFSNNPDLVYLLAGRPARSTPPADQWQSPVARTRFEQELRQVLERGEVVHLVWFSNHWRSQLADLPNLAARIPLQPMVRFQDRSGGVYRVRSEGMADGGTRPDR